VDTSILPSIAVLSSQSLELLHVSCPACHDQTPPNARFNATSKLPPPRPKSYGIAKHKPTRMALFILA
jgi:hypothetical protein